jgi:hypothetical protein
LQNAACLHTWLSPCANPVSHSRLLLLLSSCCCAFLLQVREFVASIGHENLQKRLINSREGKVKFEKPSMSLDILMHYGKSLVGEQDNVKRVQLADAYMAGAELAGSTGSSVPEQYKGAKNLNLSENRPATRGKAPAPAPRAAPAPEPVRSAPVPTPAASSGGDRWSSYSRDSSPAPAGRSSGGAAPAGALSASDLAKFKIADLVEIGAKKGVSGGRNATRDTLTSALLKAGVSAADLTKGQLSELKAGGGSSSFGSAPSTPSYSAPAAAPAASSGGDRWSSYSRDSSPAPAGRSSGSGDAKLSAGDMSAFKIADLVEIGAKKGVTGGRNATRDSLVGDLVKAGVSLSDLTRGQLVDLGTKLGKAGLSRDVNAARAELASLVGGSGSATASWRASAAPTSTPASSQQPPASWRSTPSSSSSGSAGGDRWSSYSRGSTPAASGSGGSGSSGAAGGKLSASDLSILRIDDLQDLVKKTGAQIPREATKDGVISALVAKGVSVNECTRGELRCGCRQYHNMQEVALLAGICIVLMHCNGGLHQVVRWLQDCLLACACPSRAGQHRVLQGCINSLPDSMKGLFSSIGASLVSPPLLTLLLCFAQTSSCRHAG